MKSSAGKKRTAEVLILGDDPLAGEYAEALAPSGYKVTLHPQLKSVKSLGGRASIALELTNTDPLAKKSNLIALDKVLPETTAILTSSITITVLEQSSWLSMKHRLVGIAALPTFIAREVAEVAPSIYTLPSTVDVARNFFSSIKKEIAIVQDRVGMVLPRILCQIINEALFAVQQGVASPQEIDLAMKLGMNFPMGPLEWGEKIGFDQVYALLDALQKDLREERYRICPLLKEIATTGKFWGEKAGVRETL